MLNCSPGVARLTLWRNAPLMHSSSLPNIIGDGLFTYLLTKPLKLRSGAGAALALCREPAFSLSRVRRRHDTASPGLSVGAIFFPGDGTSGLFLTGFRLRLVSSNSPQLRKRRVILS